MQTTELEIAPATTKETAELIEREQRIERCQRNAYYEIGLELKAIRDSELYAAPREHKVSGKYSFTTFEEYCEARWEMAESRARQLILAANAVDALKTVTNVTLLPTRESHVRALLELEKDEDRAAVWKSVSESGNPITAREIEDAVRKFKDAKEKNWITLEEWNTLDGAAKESALIVQPFYDAKFNAQDSTNIEWARHSWNPVTGCLHGCQYCYARDIAQRFYPQEFAPSIIPTRLSAPANTPVPNNPAWTKFEKTAHKNVFTCSMADLFGKWVPDAWINAVLERVAENPQWNFLFLTKFPERMAEIDFPKNAWVGTSVDRQAAVSRAEKAFSKVKASVKWLSCEPMMERLTFSNIAIFDWVVVGGASKSTLTEAFLPPFEWIAHIYSQCKSKNVSVYMKTNLLGDRVLEYPEAFSK